MSEMLRKFSCFFFFNFRIYLICKNSCPYLIFFLKFDRILKSSRRSQAFNSSTLHSNPHYEKLNETNKKKRSKRIYSFHGWKQKYILQSLYFLANVFRFKAQNVILWYFIFFFQEELLFSFSFSQYILCIFCSNVERFLSSKFWQGYWIQILVNFRSRNVNKTNWTWMFVGRANFSGGFFSSVYF